MLTERDQYILRHLQEVGSMLDNLLLVIREDKHGFRAEMVRINNQGYAIVEDLMREEMEGDPNGKRQ